MPPTLVLSQLPEPMNAMLAAAAPDAEIRPWPPGATMALPPEASVLLPMPFASAGETPTLLSPPGWPAGIRWVQLFTAGLDYYPRWLFTDCTVTGADGASSQAVAEFAIAAVMAAAKRFPQSWIDTAADWRRQPPLGCIGGTKLGIVGFGAIGRRVATMGLVLGMDVQVVRRATIPPDVIGVRQSAGLADLFASSDHVVLALSGDIASHGLIDEAVLRAAKPGLHLVNVARGRVVDQDALLAALDDGPLSRATLDVVYPEPLPPGHPFYGHPRVLLSPHVAFDTAATSRALVDIFTRNLGRFRRGEPLEAVVTVR
jgi:phosphoglycerate dehydrogenase-like enzyme